MSRTEKPAHARALNIIEGLIAILIWIGCYFFVNWYKSVGFLSYLKVAVPIAAFLCIVALISGRARSFLSDRVPHALECLFDTYEEKWAG